MAAKLATKSQKTSVLSLECQLAQVQIRRFLNGDNIPEELLKELENHLKHCSDCLAVAKGEKAAVEAHMIATPSAAVAERQSRPLTGVLDVFKQPKTLLLSVALAVVLIVMSTVLRDPTKLLGTKAIGSFAGTVSEEVKPGDKASEPSDKVKESGDDPTDADHPGPSEPDKKASVAQNATGDQTASPAEAAVAAARDAAKQDTPAPESTAKEPSKPVTSVPGATGHPTLGKRPILEANEGSGKPKPPAVHGSTRRRTSTTRRSTTTKRPAKSGSKSTKSTGKPAEIHVYKD